MDLFMWEPTYEAKPAAACQNVVVLQKRKPKYMHSRLFMHG
ncbi:hypothetical protein HanPSC8_Chr01g0023551 [Helianthus annuus]|nr:hypothetical protein HanPSC8_Chr01g0023551 [Helianthus annuus]